MKGEERDERNHVIRMARRMQRKKERIYAKTGYKGKTIKGRRH